MTSASVRVDHVLGPAPDLDAFHRRGYLVLPGLLPDELVARLRPEVDSWVDDGLRARAIEAAVNPAENPDPPPLELEFPAHGELVAHPPLLELLARLMEGDVVHHHLHSDRQAPDIPGKALHHDYEQRPQTDREHPMIHCLHYLNGLHPDSSALVVLPGSHHEVHEKDAWEHLGTASLPGEVVIDRLPPGSTVVVHSAVFHARRSAPVSATSRPRYFVDASYCRTGVQWPPVKPYWRYMLARARTLGLDRGRWPELFSEQFFSEYVRPTPARS